MVTWAPTLWGIVVNVLASAGGGAAIAIGLFKLFGERWLDERSKSRAADDKHRRDQALEDLKARIQRQFDRVTKLSQREFDVLPEIWMKIVDAHSAVENVSTRLRRRIDLSQLSEDEVKAQLDNLDVSAAVRGPILAADGYYKNQLYWHLLERLDAAEVKNKAVDAHFALARLGIFLPVKLHQQLEDMKEFIWEAAIDHASQVEMRAGGAVNESEDRPIELFRRSGKTRLAETETAVRERLRSPLIES